MAQMSYKEALDYAIFAINTFMHPEGSGAEDVDELEKRSDDVIETLADIRLAVQELPAAPAVKDEDLRLSFSPTAIRDHFEADDPDPTKGMTDDELREIGWAALTNDGLYETFHQILVDEVAYAKEEALKH